MADNDSLSEFLASAVDAARKAGEIIRKGFYQTKHVEHKGQVDLVTETDKACEELIFNHLKQLYPTHKFIGEETTAAFGTTELTDEPTWIVDPLDGTTNFVHGFPFVCVSIGLTVGKIPTVGVVYNPIINELFTGIRGKGASLNGNPIRVSSQTELMSSLLANEAGTKLDKLTVDACTRRINSLLFKVRSLRMTGSCALNLCGIACGRLDVCFELGFGGPWDVAGGAVIVREAGGVMFDPSGADFDITSQRVAASNPFLKDALVDALRQTDLGGTRNKIQEFLGVLVGRFMAMLLRDRGRVKEAILPEVDQGGCAVRKGQGSENGYLVVLIRGRQSRDRVTDTSRLQLRVGVSDGGSVRCWASIGLWDSNQSLCSNHGWVEIVVWVDGPSNPPICGCCYSTVPECYV